jgi:hypothetical protein
MEATRLAAHPAAAAAAAAAVGRVVVGDFFHAKTCWQIKAKVWVQEEMPRYFLILLLLLLQLLMVAP